MKKHLRVRKEHSVTIAIGLIISLILISISLSLYNKRVMERTIALKEQARQVKFLGSEVFHNTIRNIDVSVRGYAVMQEDRFLFFPPSQARKNDERILSSLDSLLMVQHYPDSLNTLRQVRAVMNEYIDMYDQMVAFIKQGQMEEFKKLLAQDKGIVVWETWSDFNNKLSNYENQLEQQAQDDYKAAANFNMIVQVLLLLIGVPTLGLVIYRLKEEEKKRRNLLLSLEENNRKYWFNSGMEVDVSSSAAVLENSIHITQKTSAFIKQITAGDYDQKFELLNETNQAFNQETLVGELIKMQDQLRKMKQEDEKRRWITEGQAKFAEIVRIHQHDMTSLTQQTLTFLVKYLNAQQGSLFVLENEGESAYLKLAACYAFNRKKFLEKRIELGQGLVGQIYLEGETALLTEIPQNYTYITSGLGDATPTCLLIVPAKSSEKTEAVVELVSFMRYEPYQVSFLEKASEILAATLVSAKNNEKMRTLLQESQFQAEQMRAQEEEMRQNMEELVATQEELYRKEKVLQQQLNQQNAMTD